MKKINVAVLVSGRGSNLQSIIDACASGKINAEVALVVSDKKDAFALERARKNSIEAVFSNPKDFPSREEHEKAIIKLIDGKKTDLVCLAGYMRILTGYFVNHYKGRLMNIHPALLPSFPGAHGQRDALNHGVKVSGCTVHFVDEGEDTGPIIIQAAVPVKEGDTEETLAARILEQEHKVFPEAINLFASDKLEIKGNKVKIIQ